MTRREPLDAAGQWRCLHCGAIPASQWLNDHDPYAPCNTCHETCWTYDNSTPKDAA